MMHTYYMYVIHTRGPRGCPRKSKGQEKLFDIHFYTMFRGGGECSEIKENMLFVLKICVLNPKFQILSWEGGGGEGCKASYLDTRLIHTVCT